ncbi:hypothetical protein TNCV_571691 [Trichonephila clavipes]|nr:hypothetical protein TNCV_571691 [Trichonephila clavipes]
MRQVIQALGASKQASKKSSTVKRPENSFIEEFRALSRLAAPLYPIQLSAAKTRHKEAVIRSFLPIQRFDSPSPVGGKKRKGVVPWKRLVIPPANSNLGHHTGQANAVRGINADQIKCSQLASLDKNNALREIKLRLSYLQGKSTTMSVIAHQTEKEWISANEKSRQRMSQTQAEGAAKQHAARLEEAHLRAHHSCFTTSERC